MLDKINSAISWFYDTFIISSLARNRDYKLRLLIKEEFLLNEVDSGSGNILVCEKDCKPVYLNPSQTKEAFPLYYLISVDKKDIDDVTSNKIVIPNTQLKKIYLSSKYDNSNTICYITSSLLGNLFVITINERLYLTNLNYEDFILINIKDNTVSNTKIEFHPLENTTILIYSNLQISVNVICDLKKFNIKQSFSDNYNDIVTCKYSLNGK